MCTFLSLIWLLFSIVFWNVENCFDYKNGGFSASDKEFSSQGDKHWNKKRFDAKIGLIGKSLLWAGAPEVVGLAEVENDFVLKRLIYSDVLQKQGYRFVHYESRDTRGIDVALLYKEECWQLLKSEPVPMMTRDKYGHTHIMNSRDILYVQLKKRDNGEVWHFFVNHHPSKLGGSKSVGKRLDAMRTLMENVTGLLSEGERNIVTMGDFNDTPDGEAFELAEGCLVNMGAAILKSSGKFKDRTGSIRFKGQWELIDNFLITPYLAERMTMKILRPPFLLERDKQFPGDKPRRTYIGPRYNGGVSDHLPVKLSTAGPAAAE